MPYPRARTLSITDISPEGAVSNGEVVLPGEQEVLENGFVWQEVTNPLTAFWERKVMEKAILTGTFSAPVKTTLKPDTQYM